MRFYLGTHRPNWLGQIEVPLFISHRRLIDRRTFPRASARWALDSGAFTELDQYGEWRTTEAAYLAAVERYRQEIGQLDWVSPMDWMCEPSMVAKTGLSVDEHQRRTVANFIRLRERNDLVVPVLQGWEPSDYERCVNLYERSGVDLAAEPVVGLGSVCRRQNTAQFARVLGALDGLNLHGFGIKLTGLRSAAHRLVSADSLAWSYEARRSSPLPECEHRNCTNCQRYALVWRERALARIADNSLSQDERANWLTLC